MEIEWDPAKSDANLRVHGVSFELAETLFADAFAIERLDDREDYGELRFVIIGMAADQTSIVRSLYGTRGANPHHFRKETDTP